MKPDSNRAVQYIKNLIRSGEGLQLDFKYEISDAKKIARTFSAFANTCGGKLLIGVKDNGRISGIQSDEEAYMIESAAHIYCKPAVVYHIHKWQIEGKWILEVEIPQSKTRPHFAKNEKEKWMAYVRVKDENLKADSILVSVWKNKSKRKSAVFSFNKEEKALMDYLKDHDEISLSKFLKIARINARQAENILVNLILMDVIEIVVSSQSVRFRKNPKDPSTAAPGLNEAC